jgi:hypothetical protein
MGGTTPVSGLPYPVGTDPARDGDNAIRALAEGVDGMIRAGIFVRGTDGAGNAVLPVVPPFAGTPTGVTVTDAHPTASPALMKLVSYDRNQIVVRVFDANGAVVANWPDAAFSWIMVGRATLATTKPGPEVTS